MPDALRLFSMGGIPVYANLWYGLILGFLAYQQPSLGYSLAIIAAWTVSLLVHEFGHAVVAKRYGLAPQILLHGIGGLCRHNPTSDDRKHAFVIIAGPGLEIVFGLLIWGLEMGIEAGAPEMLVQPHSDTHDVVTPFGYMLDQTVFLSVAWGALNLIPLHPLDGGQLFRLFMRRKQRPVQAEKVTHLVSMVVGVAAGIWGYTAGYPFATLMAAMLVYSNWESYSSLNASYPTRRKNVFAEALLKDAEAAFAQEDWHEASRMAHQVRDQSNIAEKVQHRAFEIIVLANVGMKDWKEAAGYLEHAPDSAAIRQARTVIEAGLAEDQEEAW